MDATAESYLKIFAVKIPDVAENIRYATLSVNFD
jgi:hypothetical protein